jgi:hypothetical protein
LLTGRPVPGISETAAEIDEVQQEGFIGQLVAELGEVPCFLRGSLVLLSGLPRLSLKDFFRIGGTESATHPYLAGGLLAAVNRQKKRPNDCGSTPLWQQLLYVILKRDGTYRSACCSRENSSLVVHSYPGAYPAISAMEMISRERAGLNGAASQSPNTSRITNPERASRASNCFRD